MQFRSINQLNPKTSFRTKTLYVFGESATHMLERATTEIRQGFLMKPSLPTAGKIDFGAKPEMKMQIISKGMPAFSKQPPPKVGMFEKP